MKTTEKIFLGLYIFLIILLITGNGGTHGYFTLVTFILALIYAVFAYWIFNKKGQRAEFLPILSGLGIATGVLSIHFNRLLRQEDLFDTYFPLLTLIALFFLLLDVIRKLLKGIKVDRYKYQLLGRITPIGIFAGFLAFGSPYTGMYRTVIISLNPGHDGLISNMRMFEFGDKAKKSLEEGECESALKFSLKAFNEGRNWLNQMGYSEDQVLETELWKISSLYIKVYRSYDCLSEGARDDGKYDLSLELQKKADSVININPLERDIECHRRRANSKNDIAVCFENLNIYDSAFHYYSEAIKYYNDSVGVKDARLAMLISNFGFALKEYEHYEESNSILKAALRIYKLDSTYEEVDSKMAELYLTMARNDLNQRDVISAKTNLKSYSQIATPTNSCLYEIYSGIAHLYSDNYDSVDYRARQAMTCYVRKYNKNIEANANCNILLYESKLAKAEFDSAQFYLDEALAIARVILPNNSFKFAEYYNRQGNLNYSIGKYSEAKVFYEKCENLFDIYLEGNDPEYIEIYSSLALIHSILGNVKKSVSYLDKAMELSYASGLFSEKSFTYLMNQLAYANYYIGDIEHADSIYNVAYALNKEGQKDTQLANTINGLGLVSMNMMEYEKSDSLFVQSAELYEQYLMNDHPAIGTILMSRGELYMSLKDYESSLRFLNQAFSSFNKYYDNLHPDNGRVNLLLAQAYFYSNNIELGENHAQTALEILSENFSKDHSLVKAAARVLQVNKKYVQ